MLVDAEPRRPTDRELQVLELLSHGLSEKQIALRLGVTRKTVSSLKLTLYKRLGVHTAAAAVRVCIERGWLVVEEHCQDPVPTNISV